LTWLKGVGSGLPLIVAALGRGSPPVIPQCNKYRYGASK
jgi:hypothetical protein